MTPETIVMLTVDHTASALECAPSRVEQALRDGDLPGVQFGRTWLIPASALAARLHEKSLADAAQRRQKTNTPAPRTAVLHAVKDVKKLPPALP